MKTSKIGVIGVVILMLSGGMECSAWASSAKAVFFLPASDFFPSNVATVIQRKKSQQKRVEVIEQRVDARRTAVQSIGQNGRPQDLDNFIRSKQEAAEQRVEQILERLYARQRKLASISHSNIDIEELIQDKTQRAERRLRRIHSHRSTIASRRSRGIEFNRKFSSPEPVKIREPRKIALRRIEPGGVSMRGVTIRQVALRDLELDDVKIRRKLPRSIEVRGL